jgi:hypothetical protein
MLGDIAFTGIISEQPDRNRQRYVEVVPALCSADMVFANLEVPVKADHSRNEYKTFIHYSHPGPTGDLLKLLNIGCVSLANNHVFDCKLPGLQATIDILDELGIFHTGAGWLPEHIKPVIIDKNDCTIAFLAYVDKNTNPGTEQFPELLINYFDVKRVLADIGDVRDSVDRIIVSLHWGRDYSNFYTKNQQELARQMVDAGADIIMGHHPHTLQPYEIFDGKLIFYSLGQLCFGDTVWEGKLRALKKKTKSGMIVKITIDRDYLNHSLVPTIEKQENYLAIPVFDLEKKLIKLGYINKKINLHKSIEFIARFKETVLDRFYDYFFGYYRNFPSQLFGLFLHFRKFQYLLRDFKNYKKK